jgi:hypothetical protein
MPKCPAVAAAPSTNRSALHTRRINPASTAKTAMPICVFLSLFSGKLAQNRQKIKVPPGFHTLCLAFLLQ